MSAVLAAEQWMEELALLSWAVVKSLGTVSVETHWMEARLEPHPVTAAAFREDLADQRKMAADSSTALSRAVVSQREVAPAEGRGARSLEAAQTEDPGVFPEAGPVAARAATPADLGMSSPPMASKSHNERRKRGPRPYLPTLNPRAPRHRKKKPPLAGLYRKPSIISLFQNATLYEAPHV